MGYFEQALKRRRRIFVFSLLAAIGFLAADVIFYVESGSIPFSYITAALVWIAVSILNFRMVISLKKELKKLERRN